MGREGGGGREREKEGERGGERERERERDGRTFSVGRRCEPPPCGSQAADNEPALGLVLKSTGFPLPYPQPPYVPTTLSTVGSMSYSLEV